MGILGSMAGYLTKQQRVSIAGSEDLVVRSLLDRQQYADPLGEAERLGISPATWPIFGVLWPSGAELAARLLARPAAPGERILEVGCGLALASMALHRRGSDVTASDCHPLAGPFLAANLGLNGLPPMKYRHGEWADASPAAESPAAAEADGARLRGRFDLIVGSDVLYDRDAAIALAGFIARHAAPEAEVWIVDPDRGNRPGFHRLMAAEGFGLREERLDRPAVAGAEAYKGRLLVYRRCG